MKEHFEKEISEKKKQKLNKRLSLISGNLVLNLKGGYTRPPWIYSRHGGERFRKCDEGSKSSSAEGEFCYRANYFLLLLHSVTQKRLKKKKKHLTACKIFSTLFVHTPPCFVQRSEKRNGKCNGDLLGRELFRYNAIFQKLLLVF